MMQVDCFPGAVVVSRPLSQRVAEAPRALVAALAAWRKAARERRDAQRTLAALVGLDDHTLRDIGASDDLRAHAAAQQAAAYERFSGVLR